MENQTAIDLFLEICEALDRFDRLEEYSKLMGLSVLVQVEYDDLYEYLIIEERKQWKDTDEKVIETIVSGLDVDFPMIRFQLGMLPDQMQV